ncbi:MAG: ABC transporter ATP-binding protein [Christensenellales bacterium]
MAKLNQEKKQNVPIKEHSVYRLFLLVFPYKRQLALICFLVLIASIADLATPYLLQYLIDNILPNPEMHRSLIFWGIGVAYFIITATGTLCDMGQVRLLSRLVQKLLAEMRTRVFQAIMRMKLPTLDKYGTGRLITRATNDVEALNEFYGDVMINTFKDFIVLIGITIAMLVMDLRMALVAFAVVPIIFLIVVLVKKVLRNNFVKMKALISRINGFFSENISGSRVIALFNRQKNKLEEFNELNRAYYRTTMIQVTLNSVLRPIMEVINSLAIAILVGFGYFGITGGWLKVGVLYAFTTYVKKFFQPINNLADMFNTIQSAIVSADRIFEILDQKDAQENIQKGSYRQLVIGRIEFDHVWFAYIDNEWVLQDVSFTIEPGQKAAFVGATGAGKTTIINLISKFYIPQKGEIRIDGVPLNDWQTETLRRSVSVVLQDVFLFSGTIRDNISIHAPLTDSEIQNALSLSMASEFVEHLPGGYNAQLTERGSTLSTGQRQLLCFARAIAHDPAILVLDEATAHIDTNTERLIQASIQSISKNRTAIFIAHRLSTIRSCDCIYVIQRGRIIESGNHTSLMEKKGVYYTLVETQHALVGDNPED